MNNDLRYYGNPMNWKNTNGDLISRQALKNELNKNRYYVTYKVFEIVDNAPAVASERPRGEWTDESQESLKCSACGMRVYKPFIGGFPTERTKHYWPNYCAFCGADMRKEGEP